MRNRHNETPRLRHGRPADRSRAGIVALLICASTAACGTDEPVFTNTGAVIVTGGVLATTGGVLATTGGVLATTGGVLATTGGIKATTGGIEATTGGIEATTGGTEATTGGVEATTGGVEATTGGVEATGGDVLEGDCCPDGNCVCHGPEPTRLSDAPGPFGTDSYNVAGVGCIYYPTDAEPPFAAVAISDGFLGSGGCGRAQTGLWGPLYASHGIVAMVVQTTGADVPAIRGTKLLAGVEGFKAENKKSGSPLFEKLSGRYGTSGFSMGGGGTTFSANADPSLKSSVAIMPWGPENGGTVPTLFICGASDGTASCRSHGTPAYNAMPSSTSKMIATVSGGHVGQPTAGGGDSGALGLAFQKVFLEGDERWRSVLLSGDFDQSNVQ